MFLGHIKIGHLGLTRPPIIVRDERSVFFTTRLCGKELEGSQSNVLEADRLAKIFRLFWKHDITFDQLNVPVIS